MSRSAYAVDAEDLVIADEKVGDWTLSEFAFSKQLVYRISSSSVNSNGWDITFDFAPADGCLPATAVLVVNFGSYVESLNNGLVSLSYQLPKQNEVHEIAKTVMGNGEAFAFFSLERLTVSYLAKAKPSARLAIWIPESGDGQVKRSSNIYFSLDGFGSAYSKARKLCEANK